MRERPATDGGASVRSQVPVFGATCLSQDEFDEVLATMRSGWSGTGPKVL